MEELTKKQKLKLKAKASSKKFKKELKKSILTGIVAAFGFLMALTWKEVITEYVSKISRLSPLTGKVFEAITITLISVAGILIITHILSEKQNEPDKP